jgi:hypothetical protein
MDQATLRALVEEAILAPSSHNTQPWLFKMRDGAIALHADRTRALPVADPHDRELVISCGCALFNLRVAAAERGLGTAVAALPDAADEDLLARIAITGSPDRALGELAAFIPVRRTWRKRFADHALSPDTVQALAAAAGAEAGWLVALEDAADRATAARLVAEGDASLWADPRWRRELALWMHPRRAGDGLSVPWLALPLARSVVRSFDMGEGQGARDQDLAAHSPLLAVLGTPGDGTGDHLAAGQALQRVLLEAARRGLQASFLNQPVQVAALRPDLAALCGGDGFPQILLRLGVAQDALPPVPRRPLDEVVLD